MGAQGQITPHLERQSSPVPSEFTARACFQRAGSEGPTLSSIDGEFKIGRVIGARLPLTDFDLGPQHL